VYGEPSRTPIDESMATRPINPYGETKLAVERALPHLARAHGLRWMALRYFNAAGAHPDGTIGEDHAPEIHLIPRAIAAASGGPALRVFGEDYPTPDGTCLRDYIHVTDLATAHILALDAMRPDGAGLRVYNLGAQSAVSVKELIEQARRVTGRPIPARVGPRRPGDPPALLASSGRIRSELGWAPAHSALQTILQSAWDWHRAHPGGYAD
jgi:UDP-glucose-4-epimerase GalE